MNLKTKSSLLVAGLLMLVFGVGVLAQDYLIRTSLKRTIANQQFMLVSRAANGIDNRVGVSLEALRRLAGGVSPAHVGSPERLRSYLRDNDGLLALFDSLVVVSPAFQVLADMPASTNGGNGTMQLTHLEKVFAFRQPVISEPFLGRASGRPELAIAVPVFDSLGHLIALVSGSFDLLSPGFLGGLNRHSQADGGYFVVTTLDRATIVSSDPETLLKPFAEAGRDQVYDNALTGWEGTAQGEAPASGAALMSFRSLTAADWVIGAVLPVEQAFAPLAQSRRTAAILLLGASLLVGAMVWLTMRRFLRPLLELRDNVVKLRSDPTLAGSLSAGDDEIGDVAKDFYRLFEELSRSRRDSIERAEELQSILDASPIAIAITHEHRVVRANPAFERMFGYPLAQVLGRSIERHYPDHGAFAETWARIDAEVSDGRVVKSEQRLVDRSGQAFWANVFVRLLDPAYPEKGPVMLIEDISEQKLNEERIRYLAEHDPLTNLPNRTLFNDRLAQAMVHARREGRRMALIFLDLDRFKNINDSLGHDVGDRLLKIVAERIQLSVRASDTVSRPGGDEFTLLLPEIDDLEDPAHVSAKVLQALSESFHVDGRQLMVTASIGISIYPDDGEDIATLMRNADAAMYYSKDAGRNAYHYFRPEMNERVFERMSLESALRRAVDDGEFMVCYQPQFDSRTRGIVGMEALVRWIDPEKGMVMPDRFIPVAEDTGLILRIGTWVLEQACRQNCAWQDAGLPPIPVSVNISAQQFSQPRFAETVRNVLALTGMSPDALELELTESIMIDSVERNVAVLTAIRQMGVKVSIDDFGTGYSSLSYLKRLPIDKLKIDQTFVRDIVADPDDAAIVDAIIGLARSMQLSVIAEGVETEAQLDFLQAAGCTYAQGYFFAPALSPETFEAFWRENLQSR